MKIHNMQIFIVDKTANPTSYLQKIIGPLRSLEVGSSLVFWASFFMKKSKRDTSIARNIWKSYFGEIPKDENGRSYEIHHIDGNSENNDITNLTCISIQEHYNLHLIKGEIAAANLIADRMNLSITGKQKTRWIYKGKKETLISVEKLQEYINDGWSLGMISSKGKNNPMHKSNGIKPPTLNKIWVTNGKIDLLIDKTKEISYINEKSNWKRGRCKISGDNNKKSFSGKFGALHPRSKTIYKIDINTHEILEKFSGIRQAMRLLNIKTTNICSACKSYKDYTYGLIDKPKVVKGYYWKYQD